MSEADSQKLLQIAKVLKSNGTEGGLLMGFRDISPEDITPTEPVFIYFDGLPVPYFFNSFQKKGNDKAIVTLTGVLDLADAEELVGKAVWAEEDSVDLPEDDDEDLSVFIGWTIFNKDTRIGEVTDFEDIPGNPCLYVETEDGQEVMVPLHEDLILSIQPDNQQIILDLPDGLV